MKQIIAPYVMGSDTNNVESGWLGGEWVAGGGYLQRKGGGGACCFHFTPLRHLGPIKDEQIYRLMGVVCHRVGGDPESCHIT